MSLKKIKLILLFGLIVNAVGGYAQRVYSTQKGTISFFSKTPVEDISAVNEKVSAAINIATGEVAVLAEMKHFEFPNKLMQEHFNENYMESDKYPRAYFKGKIAETLDFSKPGKQAVTADGKLQMHGVEKDCRLTGTIESKDGQMLLDTAFEVLLEDYKIKIPKAVFLKIAEKIAVKGQLALEPKK